MRKSLGRGILELIGDNNHSDSSIYPLKDLENPVHVQIDKLHPGKFQPRKNFDQESINELAASIAKNGLIQPIIVRQHLDGYEIVAGERRWRASMAANLDEVPVIVKNIDDSQCLEISIIENVHREDLTILEEAMAYKKLLDEFDHTHESVAAMLGKSRSHVSNILRILALPDSVKALLNDRSISFGHARCILNSDDPEELARKILSSDLSVRDTEAMARDYKKVKNINFSSSTTLRIENFMPEKLNVEVVVKKTTRKVSLSFCSEEQCDAFFNLLSEL